MRLADLAQCLGAEVVGDGEREIVGVRPLDEAQPQHLAVLHNRRYLEQARASLAGAVLLRDRDLLYDRVLLVCDEPYLAFARALAILHPSEPASPGVHPTAVLADGVVVGADASIGPCAVLLPGARVGDRSVIGASSVLGRRAVIGSDCVIHPNVVVEDDCRVGDRCVLHAGVVIGSDGFGFATVGGVHHKVPQVGIVVLEDDVELGANVCVDRATMGETRVGRGTKVDNLVQIAHNVVVGEGALLVSQVGISGSTRLGHHVTMAGQSGSAGHLRLGDNVIVGARAAVLHDVPDGEFVAGNPARRHKDWLKANANLYRLDALKTRVRELELAVERLRAAGEGDEP